ncbi:histidine kinase [Nonomuraea sp. B19D2]|uniref:sensor histidine kinase n=1 Tax=Nonomuraea sp. B19D2 TaxID=3159561 RepID=UPI0032DB987A
MKREALGAGVAFAMGVVLIAGGAVLQRGVSTWVLCVPLAITCAGVVVRQRAPLASLGLGVAAVAIDAFVGPSLATVLIFTDNLYAAALYGPARFARWLLFITAALAVAAGAVAGLFAEDWRMLAVMGVQAGLVLVTPVTTALVLREQRDRAAAERVRAEQVAHLAELDRQAAVAAERTRMARELHDMIANHFSAIAIQSTAALSRKDLDAATVRKIMESVRENSVKGLAEMRAMIGLLRQEGDDPAEATRPRLADAETLVERVTRAGLVAELRIQGLPGELPASVDLAGYRILQEALTNALKHGDSPVRAVISYEVGRVLVSVENAVGGRGARLPGAGAGLIGMRERASLVGGSFEAGSSGDGDLWRVVAVLPTADDQALPVGGWDRDREPVVGSRGEGERSPSVLEVRPEGA